MPFTYSRRTKDYSGWTASTRGDINTIGMAGASLATASSIAAAESNPAGFAMETASLAAQINKVSLDDKRIQRSGEPIESRQWGLGVSPHPWGFSFSYYSPMTENGEYIAPSTGHNLASEVSIKQFRLTLARVFFDNRLSIGVGLDAIKAVRELGDYSYNSIGFGYRFGALFHVVDHLVIGGTFTPQISIRPAGEPSEQYEMPGFNRNVIMPAQGGLGLGWIPNRFFKLGFSLTYVAPTINTALLADENTATGTSRTFVPRLGASYVVAEYRSFKAEIAGGSYYEMARLSGYASRIHGTGGIELNPYFVNLGAGIDVASDFKTFILSAGIDIVRTARFFGLIPPDPVPPYNGFFPKPQKVSADGLPDGLTRGEPKEYSAPDVGDIGKIIKDIPKRIEEKATGKVPLVESPPPTHVSPKEAKIKGRPSKKTPLKKQKAAPKN